MRATLLLPGCLVCALTFLTWGQNAEPVDILGRVVDYEARPVEEAQIAIFEYCYDYDAGKYSARELGRVQTGTDGRFKTQAVIRPRSQVSVVAKKPGLAMGWDMISTYGGPITEANLSIVLERAYRTTGRITDHDGKPVAGAKILLECESDYLRRLGWLVSAPNEWFSTSTDTSGEFQINNLSRDVRVHLIIEAPGCKAVHKTHCADQIFGYYIGSGKIQFQLPKESAVTGRLLDSDSNQPIAGVLVRMDTYREQPRDYVPRLTLSGHDGRFHLGGVPAQKHFLRAIVPASHEGDWVDKTRVVETRVGPANDFEIRLEKGGRIEVSVKYSGSQEMLDGVSVSVLKAGYDGFEGFHKYLQAGNRPVQIRAPFGICTVDIRAGQHTESREVEVSPGKITRAEFSIDRPLRMSGRVVDDSGKAVEGGVVNLYPVGGSARTDKSGAFTVEYGQGDKERFLLARDVQRNLAAVLRLESESDPISIRLTPGMKAKGQVVDTEGNPVASARLTLFAFSSRTILHMGSEVLTDARGRFEFLALPLTGGLFDYRYSVDSSDHGPLHYQKFSVGNDPSGVCELGRIVLKPADESISGTVVDGEGKPAWRVPMFLKGIVSGKGQPNRQSTTNERGEFIFRRICKGPLRIQANYPSFPGGAGYLEARGEDDNVKMILGQDGVHVEQRNLLGQKIPDLNDLGVSLAQGQIEAGRLLVCFFDMNQRPSRNCIMRLAKQAEQLAEKDVTVVIAQASEADQDEVDQWVKKYGIPFPAGIVRGETEKSRFKWGVQSLPWLILTDREHVVRAAGFSLGDLEQKIRENQASGE